MGGPTAFDLRERQIDALTDALAEIPAGRARDVVEVVRDGLRETLQMDIDSADRLRRLRLGIAQINARKGTT